MSSHEIITKYITTHTHPSATFTRTTVHKRLRIQKEKHVESNERNHFGKVQHRPTQKTSPRFTVVTTLGAYTRARGKHSRKSSLLATAQVALCGRVLGTSCFIHYSTIMSNYDLVHWLRWRFGSWLYCCYHYEPFNVEFILEINCRRQDRIRDLFVDLKSLG
jgi:hypothetical protein